MTLHLPSLHQCWQDLTDGCACLQIPYFNAPIFLQNKTQIGRIEEIFGGINNSVSSRMQLPHALPVVCASVPSGPDRAHISAVLHDQDAGGHCGHLIRKWGQIFHRPHEVAAPRQVSAQAQGGRRPERWDSRLVILQMLHQV